MPFRLLRLKVPVTPPVTLPAKPPFTMMAAVEVTVAVIGGRMNCSNVSPAVTEKGRVASIAPVPDKLKVRGVKLQVVAGRGGNGSTGAEATAWGVLVTVNARPTVPSKARY